VIVISTTRKPTQRIRSFIKELNRVIPGSKRLTRGKQAFAEFCEAAYDLGATRIMLVGAFHGNPGRIGFLQYSQDTWKFYPPTIILKSVQLLRENKTQSPRSVKRLVILADTSSDENKAALLAQALEAQLVNRDELPSCSSNTAVLRVAISRYTAMDFVTRDETQLLGPALRVKHFLNRAMGEPKRW
jgi:rRNA maturation protein Rpf1